MLTVHIKWHVGKSGIFEILIFSIDLVPFSMKIMKNPWIGAIFDENQGFFIIFIENGTKSMEKIKISKIPDFPPLHFIWTSSIPKIIGIGSLTKKFFQKIFFWFSIFLWFVEQFFEQNLGFLWRKFGQNPKFSKSHQLWRVVTFCSVVGWKNPDAHFEATYQYCRFCYFLLIWSEKNILSGADQNSKFR